MEYASVLLILVSTLTDLLNAFADKYVAKDRGEGREITDWTRKGPLADLPGAGRQPSGRSGGFGSSFEPAPMERGGSRRGAPEEGDGKFRDFNNWERKGPLSPAAGGPPSRESRPRATEGGREGREQATSSWGEGKSQDGSRPPRREFSERPQVERAPTAAEMDNKWRDKMRPDAAEPSATPTPEASMPSSPSQAATPAMRPRLNLAKRTVSEAAPSPSSGGDSKASPFGGARPIDTASKEREVEERKALAIRTKKEADDKAREDKRAKDTAAKEAESEDGSQENGASEKKENGDGAKGSSYKILTRDARLDDTEDAEESTEGAANGEGADSKGSKKEFVREPPTGPRAARGGRGDRGGDRGDRGGRGGGGGSEWRRKPSNPAPTSAAAPASPKVDAAPEGPDEDGFVTVQKPRGKGRGGARVGA